MTDVSGAATGSFQAFTGISVPVGLVDVGANFLDDPPPYTPVLAAGAASLVGFEPNPRALADLIARQGPGETYLPHAIGDGREHTLRVCRAEGMTSLLEPDPRVLGLFHGFSQWGEVLEHRLVPTVRLDDVPEIRVMDYLSMDIQGAELMALRHAEKRLAEAVMLRIEVEFLPLYKGQPLFADIDLFLRDRGFVLHCFSPLVKRTVQPLIVNNSVYEGLNQLLWADAVFVRDFTRPEIMTDHQLLALARLAHEIQGSFDLSLHLLQHYDQRTTADLAGRYRDRLLGEEQA
ncbi:FkbM family methyltransferase [Pararhodospirillum photometricum]|nr:FkbM family methyltransferase [Pararhodospirillum photometricum]